MYTVHYNSSFMTVQLIINTTALFKKESCADYSAEWSGTTQNWGEMTKSHLTDGNIFVYRSLIRNVEKAKHVENMT
jgi:hypothetical protein